MPDKRDMITADFVRLMARYNRWQNESLYAAADQVGEDARRAERGAFWGSIHGTLSHLLWGDGVWMARFDGGEVPGMLLSESAGFAPDWEALTVARADLDDRIVAWAEGLTLDGDAMLSWHSGVLDRDVRRPLALCIAHFFNHQTHHRGQVHAMLTAAGARPGDTDLFVMPGL